MIGSIIVTSALPVISNYYQLEWTPATRILLTVLVVLPVWLIATFLTSPVNLNTLETFYRRVHPIGTFWRPIAARCPDVVNDESVGRILVGAIAGAVGVIALSFAIGKLVLLDYGGAAWAAIICSAVAFVLWINYSNRVQGWIFGATRKGVAAELPTLLTPTPSESSAEA
jgi:hypothetical protein